tara:strand:- start:3400 stop:3744 length:345 start_codon:yes stop_codon:yes gene_type:complete
LIGKVINNNVIVFIIMKFIKILKVIVKRTFGILISVLFLILAYYLFFDLGKSSLNRTGRHYRGRLFDGVFLKIEDAIPHSKYFFGLLFLCIGACLLYLIFSNIILEAKKVFFDK